MTTPTDVALDVLLVHRITRLVTRDVIADTPRDAVIRWAYRRAPAPAFEHTEGTSWTEFAIDDPDAPKLAELITCRWCASTWIGLAVAAVRMRARPLATVRYALVLSSASTLLAGLEQ